MITLLTGLPGAGKSLSLIGMIRDYVSEGRKVFVRGIDGLDYAALGCVEWVRPFSEWVTLQPGAVLVWDEPQFSQLGVPDNRFEPPPDWMKELTMHRHHGVDIILATQDPKYLHAFARKLVGRHIHLLRKLGLSGSYKYEWDEVQVDTTKNRKKALSGPWMFPKADFAFYKSAELHTVKKRIPKRLYIVAAALVLCVVCGFGAFRVAHSLAQKPEPAVVKPEKKPADAPGLLTGLGDKGKHNMSSAEYLARLIPRIDGEPWTAPIFDKREVVAEPEVYCVDIPDQDRCQCYTEQVTKVRVDHKVCSQIAKEGVYNPYRKPHHEAEGLSDGRLARDGHNAPTGYPQGFFPVQSVGEGVGASAAAESPAQSQGHGQAGMLGHRPLSEKWHPEEFAPSTTQY